MTDPTLTQITLIIDRSGSMASMQAEAEAGINHFLQEQARQPGRALLTLAQFDTDYEIVYEGVELADLDTHYRLIPRGMTALLDAVGRTIAHVGKRLARLPEAHRPGKVVVVIVTDGHENSSHEYTKEAIRQMIQLQQDTYQWQFVFLGADAAAFDDARSYGVTMDNVARYTGQTVQQTYSAVSANLSAFRGGQSATMAWSDEQREELAGETQNP